MFPSGGIVFSEAPVIEKVIPEELFYNVFGNIRELDFKFSAQGGDAVIAVPEQLQRVQVDLIHYATYFRSIAGSKGELPSVKTWQRRKWTRHQLNGRRSAAGPIKSSVSLCYHRMR